MPQLKSGRHVALSASPLLDRLSFGSDTSVSAIIVAYRLNVNSPRDLLNFVTVGYFREGEGTPPNAPSYSSGFSVSEVLAGKAGWSQDEIDEFNDWLNSNEKLNVWLEEQFESINIAIRDSLVWETPLWSDDQSELPDPDQ
jgi:hypothetical protein